ncbi:MAG: heavy metal translocating P-type ATPase [Bacteroidota bacterium]
MKKETFAVEGMSCAACAVSVESMLGAQAGVARAAVNYAGKSVLVEYDPQQIAFPQMQKAIHDIGYEIIADPEAEREEIEKREAAAYKLLKTKATVAIALALPVMIIGMFFHHTLPGANWIMLALTIPIMLWSGASFFKNAVKQARHGSSNMDTLVALSTGIAFIFSAFNTVYPQFFLKRGLEPHVYFEAAAVIIALILLGKVLEEGAKSRTSGAIKKLMGLQPKTVRVFKNGVETEIAIEEVQLGDEIGIRPGEKIPVDGAVVNGSSYIDESMITGEPVAVLKESGAKVFAGTINQKGSLRITAEKVGRETMLGNIIRMVREAQGSKAPIQKLADKISAVFVPVVLVIAVLTFAVWMIAGGGFSHAMMAMITVLIIACPCALGLATPTALMVGIGRGAEHGILIKDAEALERAFKINAVILDKTGTITNGKPEVTDIVWNEKFLKNNSYEKDFLKSVILSAESPSEHPLAEAVVRFFKKENIAALEAENFESITGQGISVTLKNEKFFIGNSALLKSQNITIPNELLKTAQQLSQSAKTVVYAANTREVFAIIAIADTIKETSAEAVRDLLKSGVEVHMLTGDNEETARAVSEQVGIKHFKAGVMPQDKADYIRELQKRGKVVAMAGDGINDSQALAVADVGIAMARGTDIAMDVAAITLMQSDLRHVASAIRLSKATVRTIRQNLFWAFIYNVIGIPLAAGILYPVNGFLLNPMIAGAAMALSSVSVVANSLRLKSIKL